MSEEARAEIEANQKSNPAQDVRRWLLQKKNATLCTQSARKNLEGHPFGSIVPFALDAQGLPVILIANIAAHTKNLMRDSRASLFVHEEKRDGDPQSGWRITLMGRFERLVNAANGEGAKPNDVVVSDDELRAIDARYRERVPAAKTYMATHGFDYWRMSSFEAVRYIAGFGRICWADAKACKRTLNDDFLAMREGALSHMNEDHQDALKLYCQAQTGVSPEQSEMLDLHPDGFLVRTKNPDDLRFISFGHEVGAEELRQEVVRLAKDAREKLGIKP